jgi:hypothetical protein
VEQLTSENGRLMELGNATRADRDRLQTLLQRHVQVCGLQKNNR